MAKEYLKAGSFYVKIILYICFKKTKDVLIMKKIPKESLNIENINAFVEENKDKRLFELFEVKEEYDVGDTESRRIEILDANIRVFNTFKHCNKDIIGKGPDTSRNLLDITVGELETKFGRFIGKRGIVDLLEKLNGFLKDEYPSMSSKIRHYAVGYGGILNYNPP